MLETVPGAAAQKYQFVASMKTPRPRNNRMKNVQHLTIAEARSKLHGSTPTLNEYLQGIAEVIPYVDVDAKYADKPEPEEFDRIFANFKSNLSRMMDEQDGFNIDTVIFAQRHGDIALTSTGCTYKLSYRAFLRGWKSSVPGVKRLIESKNLKGDADGLFDTNPYKENDQLLACVYGVKGEKDGVHDGRVLTPITECDYSEFIVQHLKGDEKTLVVPSVRRKPVRAANNLSSPSPEGYSDSVAEDDEVKVLLEMLTVEHWDDEGKWFHTATILRNIAQQKYRNTWLRLSQRSKKFDGIDKALAAWERAGRDDYEGSPLTLGTLKKYAEACSPGAYGKHQHMQDTLKMVIETPRTDSPYAKIFIALENDRYMCCGDDMLEFNGTRWLRVDDKVLKSRIERVCEKVLLSEGQKTQRERVELDAKGEGGSSKAAQLTATYASYKKGFDYLRKAANVASILTSVKFKVVEPNHMKLLDMNPYLLGVENGVIDLKTLTLREGRRQDYITLSTGYAYFDDKTPYEPEVMREFLEEFINKIYPIEEERQQVQRYSGYCLLGEHPQKKCGVFTDKRDGNNGKSAFTGLLRSSLGNDYACQPKADLVYKSDFVRNENDHSAGMLSYIKKRLLVIEETDKTKSLDTQLLKTYNGGGTAQVRGRGLHGKETQEHTWITKFIINCNEGNLPKLDVSDSAALNRLFIAVHRSRFYCAAEYELHKHEPYTYLEDPDMASRKFRKWRPYMLRWCLDGLRMYWEQGLGVAPESSIELKAEIVASNNPVKAYLDDRIEFTGFKKDYITRSDMYLSFCSANQDLQRTKERISKQDFKTLLHQHCGAENYKSKSHGRHDIYRCWSVKVEVEKEVDVDSDSSDE